MKRPIGWLQARRDKVRNSLGTHVYVKWFIPFVSYVAGVAGFGLWLARDWGDPFWMAADIGEMVTLAIAAAAVWKALRYARVDANMADSWYARSLTRWVLVGAFGILSAAYVVLGIAYRQYWYGAAFAILSGVGAYSWWKLWGDGGGWSQEDTPDWPQEPDGETIDLPPELVEPTMRPRSVDAGPTVDDRVRGQDAA